MEDDIFDDDLADYESGPYCQHFSDPGDCEEICRCGHKCNEHLFDTCNVNNCPCEGFQEPE